MKSFSIQFHSTQVMSYITDHNYGQSIRPVKDKSADISALIPQRKNPLIPFSQDYKILSSIKDKFIIFAINLIYERYGGNC